jgi:dimethylargininase
MILAPHGFQVVPVPVTGCLHLKSAVTAVPPEGGRYSEVPLPRLLLNPAWIDRSFFTGFDLIDVDPSEPDAGNVLLVGDRVVCADAHTKTRRRLEAHGIPTSAVAAGELARAEGGVTCCSIIFTVGS